MFNLKITANSVCAKDSCADRVSKEVSDSLQLITIVTIEQGNPTFVHNPHTSKVSLFTGEVEVGVYFSESTASLLVLFAQHTFSKYLK